MHLLCCCANCCQKDTSPVRTNTTKGWNYLTDPTKASASETPAGGRLYYWNQWLWDCSPNIQNNCFSTGSNAVTEECRPKWGWKNVQARKNWHGVTGFNAEADTLVDWAAGEFYQPIESTPPTTRYLTCTINVSARYYSTVEYAEYDTTATIVRQASTHRYTGINTLVTCTETNSNGEADAVGMVKKMWLEGGDLAGVTYYGCNPIGSPWTSVAHYIKDRYDDTGLTSSSSPVSIHPHNSGNLGYELRLENCDVAGYTIVGEMYVASHSDSYVQLRIIFPEYDVYCESGGWSSSVSDGQDHTIEWTYSNGYTAAMVQADLTTLLSKWSLADDVVYPWRRDGSFDVAPKVQYNEAGPTSPGNMVWNDSGSVDANDDSSLGMDGYYDGLIRGEPLPIGANRYFNPRHYNGSGNGAWNDTGGAPIATASEWTESAETDTASGGYFRNATGGVCWAQKWAEIVAPRPAHNWFRPCGVDRFVMKQGKRRIIFGTAGAGTSGSPWVLTIKSDDPETTTISGKIIVANSGNSTIDGVYSSLSAQTSTTISLLASSKICDLPADAAALYDSPTVGSARWPTRWPICGTLQLTDATNATPIVITVPENHLWTGDSVTITGATGNTAANGTHTLTRLTATTFELNSTVGNGTYDANSGTVANSGSPSLAWNKSAREGRFKTVAWEWDWRRINEWTRANSEWSGCGYCPSVPAEPNAYMTGHGLSTAMYSITEAEAQVTPTRCHEIFYVSPNTESFTGAESQGYPHPASHAFDYQHGSLWQQQAFPAMGDPLWEEPHVSKAAYEYATSWGQQYDEDDTCSSDSGGAFFYPARPQEEARIATPSGAPAQVSDLGPMRCLTMAEINQATIPSTGFVCWPDDPQIKVYGQHYDCVCTPGRWATQFEASGVECEDEPI